MKKVKLMLTLLSAVLMFLSSYSCGKNENINEESSALLSSGSSSDGSSSENSDEIKSDDSSASKSSNDNKQDTSEKDSKEPTSEQSSNNSSDSSVNENKSPEAATAPKEENAKAPDNAVNDSKTPSNDNSAGNTEKAPSGSNNTGNQTNNQNSGNKNTENNSTDNKNNNSDKNTSDTNSGGSTSDSASKAPAAEAPTEAEEEVVSYAAEITLGQTSSFTGSNVTVNGSKVTITGGGDYLISGSVSDGQLEVNTTEKVKLYLNGVSITNSSGPAIQITDAKRATIKLMAGTTSNLKDSGGDKINDGAIFTNDTLEIRGKGTLNITATNAHGIASDDDIVIENGTINIKSVKSGLFAHDNITVNGGSLNIKGGTNGIKSKGSINLNGGYGEIFGGTKEEKSSVYANSGFAYTGGTFYAIGNSVTVPTQSKLPYIVAGFGSSVNGGTKISVSLSGVEAASFTPENSYKCIMMLSPDISQGASFSVNANGKSYSGYTVSGIQNVFTLS